MEYKEKSNSVQADQFFMDKAWPAGVLREPDPASKPYIEVTADEMVTLEDGDYIVRKSDEVFVLTQADFEEAYEPVKDNTGSNASADKKRYDFILAQCPDSKIAKTLDEAIGFMTVEVNSCQSKLNELLKSPKSSSTKELIEAQREITKLKGELNKLREEHKHSGGR